MSGAAMADAGDNPSRVTVVGAGVTVLTSFEHPLSSPLYALTAK